MTYFDYRTLFETLPEGVFSIDREFRITSFNHTAERISGFNRNDVMGKFCWEIFRSNRCRKNCPLSRALDTGESRMDQEVTTFNANGERQLLLVNVNVVRNDQGSPVGAVETFRSVKLDDTSALSASAWDQCITGIIGKSMVMHSVMGRLADVATTEANVLISGESGTGKELSGRGARSHPCGLSAGRMPPFIRGGSCLEPGQCP